MPDPVQGLSSKEAAENASKWLGAISTLTGAAALAGTFGIAFAPNDLSSGAETWVKAGLLTAVALVAVAIVLAAMASGRVAASGFWGNATLAKFEEQQILRGTRQKVIGSQVLASIAAVIFIVALGVSLFGPKDPSWYLYTVNAATPAAASVVCGELALDPITQAIAIASHSGELEPVISQEVLAKFESGPCPDAAGG